MLQKNYNNLFNKYLVDDDFYNYAIEHSERYQKFYEQLSLSVNNAVAYMRGRRRFLRIILFTVVLINILWLWAFVIYYFLIYRKNKKLRQVKIIESNWFNEVLDILAIAYCDPKYLEDSVEEPFKYDYTSLKLAHLLIVKEIEMNDRDVNAIISEFTMEFLKNNTYYAIAYHYTPAFQSFVDSLNEDDRRNLGITEHEEQEVEVTEDEQNILFIVRQPEFSAVYSKVKAQFEKAH